MIISCLNQKGGVGKSAIARLIAVEFSRGGWFTHLAELDFSQQTNLSWLDLRLKDESLPSPDVSAHRSPQSAISLSKTYDLVVIDGTPYASSQTLDVASSSDLVVVPCGVTNDDLLPSLRMCYELSSEHGIDPKKFYFVFTKLPIPAHSEFKNAVATVAEWGFSSCPHSLSLKTAYGKALDQGRSLSETRYKSMNESAKIVFFSIHDKVKDYVYE